VIKLIISSFARNCTSDILPFIFIQQGIPKGHRNLTHKLVCRITHLLYSALITTSCSDLMQFIQGVSFWATMYDVVCLHIFDDSPKFTSIIVTYKFY